MFRKKKSFIVGIKWNTEIHSADKMRNFALFQHHIQALFQVLQDVCIIKEYWYQAVRCSGNPLNWYSVETSFESRQTHRLPLRFLVIFSVASVPQNTQKENATKITPTITSFQIISNSLFTSYFVIYASAFQVFLSEKTLSRLEHYTETLSRLEHYTETHPYIWVGSLVKVIYFFTCSKLK